MMMMMMMVNPGNLLPLKTLPRPIDLQSRGSPQRDESCISTENIELKMHKLGQNVLSMSEI